MSPQCHPNPRGVAEAMWRLVPAICCTPSSILVPVPVAPRLKRTPTASTMLLAHRRALLGAESCCSQALLRQLIPAFYYLSNYGFRI